MSRAFTLLGLLAAVCASAADFEWVADGAARASIVATGNRTVDADVAFFTNAVFRCTGAALPVVKPTDAVKDGRVVFRIRETGILEEDDWSIGFPDASTLAIEGTEHSCRWALNRLLEDRLGVVFCMSGANGTHYPKCAAFTLPREPLAGTASLRIERSLYCEDPAWMRALGGKEQLPGRQFYNHNVCNIFPVSKYGEDPWREKLMPLLKGRRAKPTHKDMFWQPCFSAPECVTEAVRNIRAHLDARPRERVYSLTMNDCGGYCECEACRRANGGTLDAPCRFGNGKTKCRSTVYFAWANAVARELAKSHPHVVFGILAYGATIDPPPFRLEPNLLVFLCGSVYQNGDPRVGAKRLELMRAWSAKTGSFGTWDYPYGPCHYVAPRVYSKRVADFFALRNGSCPAFNAYFGEGASMFVGEGPKRYLYLKCMFDTRLDAAKTLDVWYRACAGEAAAPALKAYYDLWEDFWCGEAVRKTDWYRDVNGTYMNFRAKSYLDALDPATLDRADALAEKAHALALAHGDDGQKARAERLYAFHRFYSQRMRACGVGNPAARVPVKSAADAVRFLRALPETLGHVAAVARQVEHIRELDEAERIRGYDRAFAGFRRNAAMNEALEARINDAAGFARDTAVVEALRAAREDSRAPPVYRAFLAALSGAELPPLVDADAAGPAAALADWIAHSTYGVKVTPRDPSDPSCRTLVAASKDGTWPAVARIVRNNPKSQRYFRFRARVRNTSSKLLRVRMCRDALGMVPVSNVFEVAPGETRDLAVAGLTAYKGGYDRFYLILNGLAKGESAEVEDIALDDASAAAPETPTRPAAGTLPRLRLGVLSDIHVSTPSFVKEKRGKPRLDSATAFERALRYFRERGVDAVAIAGDLTEYGMTEELEKVAGIWRRVFPDDRGKDGAKVEKLFILGNHDALAWGWKSTWYGGYPEGAEKEARWKGSIARDPAAAWRKCFGEPYAPLELRRVKGYPFVLAHWRPGDPSQVSSRGGGEVAGLADFLGTHRGELAGERPFFYLQHAHPKGTCLPFAPGDAGGAKAALAKFPNAVAFSGHAHQSLTDERGFWHGEFVSIGTGSLVDAGGRNYRENGAPYAVGAVGETERTYLRTDECRQGLYVTYEAGRLTVERRDFTWGLAVGPPWEVPERPRTARPPAFPQGAALAQTVTDAEVRLSFPSANAGGRTYDYDARAVLLADDYESVVASRRVLAPDYHLPPEKADRPGTVAFARTALPRSCRIRFEVRPVDCRGAKGAPLTAEAKLP